MCMVMFLAMQCHGTRWKGSKTSVNKRECALPGEVCTSVSDCCGFNDSETGHCVLCTGMLPVLFNVGQRTCSCSKYSVGVDPVTHRIATDVCDGRDRTGNRICRTRIARPDESYYRGDEYYNTRRQ